MESGLLSAQLGTLTGTPIPSTAASGIAGGADLLSSTSSAKAFAVDLTSSLDPAIKNSFRNSLEVFTGPLPSANKAAKQNETAKQLVAASGTNISAKPATEPPHPLTGDARAVHPSAAAFDTPPKGAEAKAADQPADQPAGAGDLASDQQISTQLASTAEREAKVSAPIETGSDATAKPLVHARADDDSTIAATASSGRFETSSAIAMAKPAHSNAMTKMASTSPISDGAAAAQPGTSVSSKVTPEPMQSPIQVTDEPTTVPKAEGSRSEEVTSMPVCNALLDGPSAALSAASTLQAQLTPTKTSIAKSNEAKASRPAREVVGEAPVQIGQPARQNPMGMAATGVTVPALSPVPTETANTAISLNASATSGNGTYVSIHGVAGPGSLTPHISASQLLSSAALPTVDLAGLSAAASQNAAPVLSNQVSGSIAVVPELKRPPASSASLVITPLSALSPATTDGSHPTFITATEQSISDKSNTDKSTMYADPVLPDAVPNFAQHATPQSQIAEFAASATVIIPHSSSILEINNPSSSTTVTASSAQSLVSSLNTPVSGLNSVPSIEGSNAGQHTTLLATPNVLEVGVASGSHGWLKVRAELDGAGGVSASVTANSPGATETMHKDLPALSAYLSSESVGVSSLVVNQAAGTSLATANALAHDAATMNLGAGAGGGGPARDQPQLAQASPMPVDAPREGIDIVSSWLDAGFTPLQPADTGDGSEAGSWLSVRA